ncbi:MAG: SPOR domain-containing protein [Pseudomonadota bacterium]
MPFVLSGCISKTPELQQAYASGGSYAFLSCAQLEEVTLAVQQRIAFLAQPEPKVFEQVDGTGGQLESTIILQSALSDLKRQASLRDCPPPRPMPTVAEVLEEDEHDLLRNRAGKSLYLQVAIFARPANTARTIRKFENVGQTAFAEPVSVGGRIYDRVLVGPLRNRNDVYRTNVVAYELSLWDSFFRRR